MKVKDKVNSNNDFLLRTLFNYIVPFFNNNYSDNFKKNLKENNLESKLRSKKTNFDNILFLEQLILSNIKNKNIKIKKETKLGKLDLFKFFTDKNNIESKVDEEIKYSLKIINKKEEIEEKGYSISIKYEENESEEKLDVSIKLDNYGKLNLLNKNSIKNIKKYSFSITKKKENKSKDNYSVKIAYDDNYEEERLTINYKSTLGAYLNKRQEALTDFSDRVPGKFVNIFPESIMGGVLGFTYLGENFMGLRADLTGNLKKMVDIHESIHTTDEYETRILTDWIMSKERPKYIK